VGKVVGLEDFAFSNLVLNLKFKISLKLRCLLLCLTVSSRKNYKLTAVKTINSCYQSKVANGP